LPVVGDGHLLVQYPPTLSISTLVNHLKGVSSRMLRKEFTELAALARVASRGRADGVIARSQG
jgi:REP element-mobilizing transposase RayT